MRHTLAFLFLLSSTLPALAGGVSGGSTVTGTVTVRQPDGNNLHVVVDNLTPVGGQDTNLVRVNSQPVNVGIGAAGAGTQRVAVSSDSTIGLGAGVAEIGFVKNSGTFAVQASQSGVWNIGSITNPVTVTATDFDIRDLSAATDSVSIHGNVSVADQFNLSNSTPFAVAIVDSSGDQITSFGGGVQYADGASAATPTGNQINWNNGGTQASVSPTKPLPTQLRNSSGTEIGTSSNPVQVSLANTGANATAVKVDGSSSTQPVSGTVTANQGGSWTVTANAGTNLNTSALALESTLSSLNGKVTAVDTDNVTVVSSALPTGAATAVKQPALGTAGSASADVITVQGISSMTPLLVNGSGSTQPVSGTVTANQGGTWNINTLSSITNPVTVQATNLDIRDLTAASDSVSVHGSVGIADQFNLSNSNPLAMAIVDSNGDQITSFGGGVQYQVDDVAGATDTGTLSLVVRDDALSTLTPADGDYTQLRVTSTGRMWVSAAIDSAIPAGNNNIGDVDVASIAAGTNYIGKTRLTDGTTDAEVVPLTGYNAQAVAIVDGSGNQITSFGGGTQYVDGAAAATPTGNQINWNQSGTQRGVSLTQALPVQPGTGASFTVAQSTASNLNAQVAGDVANDTGDSGNPVKIGFKAKTYGSLPTAVTDADRVNGLADRYGAQFTQHGSPYVQVAAGEYSANQTATALVGSVGSGSAVRLYGFTVNIDYNAQSTITLTIGFGTSTLDTVVWKCYNLTPGPNLIALPVPVVGASDQELRVTFTGYTAGFVNLQAYYDLIVI